MARAVVPPEPGRRYRIRVAGISAPNMPGDQPKRGPLRVFSTDPDESRPAELAAGKSVRLWFVLDRAGTFPETGNRVRADHPLERALHARAGSDTSPTRQRGSPANPLAGASGW